MSVGEPGRDVGAELGQFVVRQGTLLVDQALQVAAGTYSMTMYETSRPSNSPSPAS
jgi:hypothetical protein